MISPMNVKSIWKVYKYILNIIQIRKLLIIVRRTILQYLNFQIFTHKKMIKLKIYNSISKLYLTQNQFQITSSKLGVIPSNACCLAVFSKKEVKSKETVITLVCLAL